MDLLDYYRDNLGYLRRLSGEFAAEFPKIARRLLLSEVDCQDPYIERLLEGTAFLAARVEKKLDDGYYPFLEAVLNSVAPDAMYPIPSGAVMEVSPGSSGENAANGALMEAGTVFEASIPGINTPCRFSCAASVPIVPFAVSRAEYLSRDLASLGIKNPKAESALRLGFSSPPGPGAEIRAFMALSEADASLLLRLLAQDVAGVYAGRNGEYIALEGVDFSIPLLGGEELFYKGAKPGIQGLRVLQNYLNYPDFFKFFSIRGLGPQAGPELVIAFKRREQSLGAAITASSIRLNCVPVLNLFTRRSNRINLERDAAANPFEFHVVPERTAMRDYEVVAVKSVEFYSERNELVAAASNFYDGNPASQLKNRVFFSAKRRRKMFQRRSAARSSYDGAEVFLSFSPMPDGAWQFTADLLVTNRDLPLLLSSGASLASSSALVGRAVFLTLPTRPDYPLIGRGDRGDFSRLSHIVMNLSAMLCQEGERPLELLRNLLRSYPLRPAEEMERMAGGISALSGRSDTFRFIRNGGVFYEWGWRVRLVLDEDACAGMGFYLFARVIAEVLLSLTPLNTVLELEFSTLQSGVIAVWKTPENR
jgi:type VI secretion system VasI/ImpG family protein